ncbi:MAG: TldD/PmbA family protein [Clostridia bacterium]|nr:TldD/PmbA family protein [Clostridia bacterium]
MMKSWDRLIELLRTSGADAWEAADVEEKGWEFYFIRRRLDQNRAKRVRNFDVRVYRRLEDGKYLGSAGAKIPADASEEETRRMIADLCRNAEYVRNPAYTLNPPVQAEKAETEKQADVRAISAGFLHALRSVPETETEDLNSCEIFVSEIRRHFMNSEGIDVTEVYPASMLETVVNARKEGREIELYRLYHSGSCDETQVIRDLSETLSYGRDRLNTVPTPALGQADVVFSTDAAREIYDWFITRMSAGAVFRGISDWKIGQEVQEGGDGDRVTVRAVRELPNSSRNTAYDSEGAPVRDLTLIENGRAEHYFGSRQFSQYLHLEDSFIAGNFEVTGGSATAEELRQGSCLEIVEFSDFQVDEITGDLAGEIRLAYWNDGGKRIPVSGGSVSGSMRELAKTMRFSSAGRQFDNYRIPEVTRLKNVTVTGIRETK